MAEQQSVKLDKLPDEPMATGGMVPTKHEHNWMLQAAAAVVAAGLAKQGETWQHIYLKMAKGRELQIGALSANDLLYVVKGRVAVMGRMKLALVHRCRIVAEKDLAGLVPSTET